MPLCSDRHLKRIPLPSAHGIANHLVIGVALVTSLDLKMLGPQGLGPRKGVVLVLPHNCPLGYIHYMGRVTCDPRGRFGTNDGGH